MLQPELCPCPSFLLSPHLRHPHALEQGLPFAAGVGPAQGAGPQSCLGLSTGGGRDRDGQAGPQDGLLRPPLVQGGSPTPTHILTFSPTWGCLGPCMSGPGLLLGAPPASSCPGACESSFPEGLTPEGTQMSWDKDIPAINQGEGTVSWGGGEGVQWVGRCPHGVGRTVLTAQPGRGTERKHPYCGLWRSSGFSLQLFQPFSVTSRLVWLLQKGEHTGLTNGRTVWGSLCLLVQLGHQWMFANMSATWCSTACRREGMSWGYRAKKHKAQGPPVWGLRWRMRTC